MTLLDSRRVFTGRVISLDLDTVRFPNGEIGTLELIRHPGASVVLPFLDDPRGEDPRILLLRQFRHATDDYLWEIPAGVRNGDETPETTAFRELEEETGHSAKSMKFLTRIWTTPGFTDEVITVFVATELTPGETRLEADEVLEVHAVRWSEVMSRIRDGSITDAKTLVALLFVEALVRRE